MAAQCGRVDEHTGITKTKFQNLITKTAPCGWTHGNEMDKSFNDIQAQAQRIIANAALCGRYCDNVKKQVDTQHIMQIAARARIQHRIELFTVDRDEKKPYVPQKVQRHEEIQPEITIEPKTVIKIEPVQETGNKVNRTVWFNDPANRKLLQDGCRHRFITKMLAEIMCDMAICKLEGWDVFEFPRMLRKEIEHCLPKPVQLTLF